MAQAGDKVPKVLEIRSAIANDAHSALAGFSIQTTAGETNFCMSFEQLGHFVSHALNLAQHHARELNRSALPGGVSLSMDITPETVTMSFQDVSGRNIPRIVVGIGDLTLAFLVDEGLLRNLAAQFSGPAAKKRKLPRIYFPAGPVREVRIPRHETSLTPLEIPDMPTNWASYVGFITVLWGQFEADLEDFLGVLVSANGTVMQPDWETWSMETGFDQHRTEFLRGIRITFAAHPAILAYCEQLANDASAIHVPRNLLAHGKLHGRIENNEYVLTAYGTHKYKPIKARFQEPELVSLYHEISHLCGRLSFLFDPDDSPRKPQPFSSGDKRFLEELLKNFPPRSSIPATPPP
jgi:hypothetical protein